MRYNIFKKTYHLFLLMCTALFCLVFSEASASPTETFLLLSEGEERRLEVGEALITEVRHRAEAGDYFHIVSTPSHEHILSFEIPDGVKAARLKQKTLVNEFQKLKAWLLKGPVGESRQLRLYGLPETIANLRNYSDSACRVVLVGNPVLKDEHYKGLNMVDEKGDTLVPLDGWLEGGSDSPFGPGLYSLPDKTVATWITTTSLWGPTGSIKHRQGIARFYRLWFQSQNESLLARFSSNPDKAFDFAPSAKTVSLHLRNESADMLQVSDATEQHIQDPAQRRQVQVVPELTQFVRGKQSNLPGLCWHEFLKKHASISKQITIFRLAFAADLSPTTRTDLDARLRNEKTGEEIWFENPRVRQFGRLYNDVRVGTSKFEDGGGVVDSNYEFICVEPNRSLKDCTLWVNKYVGVGDVSFQISVLVNGRKVNAKEFKFTSEKGDHGEDANTRETSENWIGIDLNELLSGR